MNTKAENRVGLQAPGEATRIEWKITGAPDGFFGTGATRAERALVWAAAFVLCGLYAALEIIGRGPEWSWWLYLIVLLLAVDLAGGMIANSLNSCKRYYHAAFASAKAETGPISKARAVGPAALLRNHFVFAAVHVHPIFVGWLFERPLYGVGWYLALQAAVWATLKAPLYLRRPLAMLWILAALLAEQYFVGPIACLEWFIPVLFLKIVYGHSVREEPYRPVD